MAPCGSKLTFAACAGRWTIPAQSGMKALLPQLPCIACSQPAWLEPLHASMTFYASRQTQLHICQVHNDDALPGSCLTASWRDAQANSSGTSVRDRLKLTAPPTGVPDAVDAHPQSPMKLLRCPRGSAEGAVVQAQGVQVAPKHPRSFLQTLGGVSQGGGSAGPGRPGGAGGT